MLVSGQEVDIKKLINEVNQDDTMLKMRGNGIYLSDAEVNILRKHGINYQSYGSLGSLIFEIEEVLNDEEDQELESLSERLSEFNYYNNTNK